MQCPRCDGTKGSMAFVNRGPDIAHHSQDWIACEDCLGTGAVTVERGEALKARIEAGKALRAERKTLGLSLRDAALVKGISPADLSRLETGREKLKPIDVD